MDAGDIVHHRVVHQTTNRRSHRATTRARAVPPIYSWASHSSWFRNGAPWQKEEKKQERNNQRQQLFQRRKEKEKKKNQGNVGR